MKPQSILLGPHFITQLGKEMSAQWLSFHEIHNWSNMLQNIIQFLTLFLFSVNEAVCLYCSRRNFLYHGMQTCFAPHHTSCSILFHFSFWSLLLVLPLELEEKLFRKKATHVRFLCHVKHFSQPVSAYWFYISFLYWTSLHWSLHRSLDRMACIGAATVVCGWITATYMSCIFINRKSIHYNQSTLLSIFVTLFFIVVIPNGVVTPKLGTTSLEKSSKKDQRID